MADVQGVLERIERDSVQTVDIRFTTCAASGSTSASRRPR